MEAGELFRSLVKISGRECVFSAWERRVGLKRMHLEFLTLF